MLKKVLLLTSLVFTTVLCSPSLANHPRSVPASYHAVSSTELDNKGGSFKAILRYIDSAWSTTSNKNLILHGIWIALGDRSWVEVGYTKGSFREPGETSSSYYDGFYTARGKYDAYGRLVDYAERKITGPSTAEGSEHFFHIAYVAGTDSWNAYVNNVRRLTYPVSSLYPSRVGRAIDVGLETNTIATYSALWNERGLQYIDNNGLFKGWTGTCNQYLDLPAFNAGLRISWVDYCTSQYTNKIR